MNPYEKAINASVLFEAMHHHWWTIDLDYLSKVWYVLFNHAIGVRYTEAEMQAYRDQERINGEPKIMSIDRFGTASIPITGVIAKRSSQVNRISGPSGTSVDAIRANFDAALADPGVRRIRFDIDSPGGVVNGIPDLSDHIRAQRGVKPMTSHVTGIMASGAYWIGSAADSIVASKSAMVGSIGVYGILQDASERFAKEGFKHEMVRAGKYKAEGHPLIGITEDARKLAQANADTHYTNFVDAVASNRGISVEKAKELGDGRVHVGPEAKRLGFVDALGPVESVFEDSGSPAGGGQAARAGGSALMVFLPR